jgi:hypothetical protein
LTLKIAAIASATKNDTHWVRLLYHPLTRSIELSNQTAILFLNLSMSFEEVAHTASIAAFNCGSWILPKTTDGDPPPSEGELPGIDVGWLVFDVLERLGGAGGQRAYKRRFVEIECEWMIFRMEVQKRLDTISQGSSLAIASTS